MRWVVTLRVNGVASREFELARDRVERADDFEDVAADLGLARAAGREHDVGLAAAHARVNSDRVDDRACGGE
jgi:hypothetical protein